VTRTRLLGAGIAGFTLALLFTAPAELLREPLRESLPGARLGAMQGHLLAGHVAPFSLGGVPFDRAEWRWRPAALLTGRLAVDLVLEQRDSRIELRAVQAPWSAETELREVAGDLDLERLGRALPRLPGRVRGQLTFDGVAITFGADGWPRHAAGRLRLHAAELVTPIALPLGKAEGTLGMDGNRLVIGFTLSPPAAITGRGTLRLGADGAYALSARLAPGNPADPEMTAWLRLAGRQESQRRNPTRTRTPGSQHDPFARPVHRGPGIDPGWRQLTGSRFPRRRG